MQTNEVAPLMHIQPTVQRQIEHMQTNEVSPLTYIQPTVQRQIEHMQNNEVGYNQPTVQRQIEQTINKPIEFNQAASLAYNPSIPQRHIVHTQNQPFEQPITQNQTTNKVPNDPTQVATVVNQPRSYNRPIGYEEKSYLCIWCETPTKFNDYKKLNKHIERFHATFNQKYKGTKRGIDDLDEISPKRLRGNGTWIPGDESDVSDSDDGYDADTDDGYDANIDDGYDTKTDDNNGENNYDGSEDDTDSDEGSDRETIRFRWRKRMIF